ncbi:MAG: glycosyltransferase, partial [Pseudomonadota bacterium]
IARRFAVEVLHSDTNSGPAAARNLGATAASGEVLVFIDADVLIDAAGLQRIATAFAEEPSLTALFGSYDAEPDAQDVVSQYRNLLHHHTHQIGAPNANTFWSGYGAVRTGSFVELGGFDTSRYAYAMEDVELGYRLSSAGCQIRLDRSLQCKHLKAWTLIGFLGTDLLARAIPWSQLIYEYPESSHALNVRGTQKIAVMSAALLFLSLVLGLFNPKFFVLSLLSLSAIVLFNISLFRCFAHARGVFFAVCCIPLHTLHHMVSGTGFLWVTTSRKIAVLKP